MVSFLFFNFNKIKVKITAITIAGKPIDKSKIHHRLFIFSYLTLTYRI